MGTDVTLSHTTTDSTGLRSEKLATKTPRTRELQEVFQDNLEGFYTQKNRCDAIQPLNNPGSKTAKLQDTWLNFH